MAATADPAYEVATIKPSDPKSDSSGFQQRGRRIIVLNETLQSMLVFAFGVQRDQIAGAPAWFSTDPYVIEGVPDAPGIPNLKQQQGMVRKVLASRFGLKLHEEQRELPVYALRVAKSGAKLPPSKGSPDGLPDQTGSGGRLQQWVFTNNSMEQFAGFLQFNMDRPVLDQTGLAGRYDFKLSWAPEAVREKDQEAGPSIFSAMPEQLGIRMEPTRGITKVLVIDAVNRPSAD